MSRRPSLARVFPARSASTVRLALAVTLTIAVILATLALPKQASAALLPSAWAEGELELAQQWGLLSDLYDAPSGGPVSRGSDSRPDPSSYTSGINKDTFTQVVVTMCEKLLGRSIDAANVQFDDRTAPACYYKAFEAGIVNGKGVTPDEAVILGRDDILSREQIAKMLYQAIVYCDPSQDSHDSEVSQDSEATQDSQVTVDVLATFSDCEDISEWARNAARYMADKGILKGVDGQFLPKAQCTFEQGVVLAKRVYEEFADEQVLKSAPMMRSGLAAPVVVKPESSPASMSLQREVKLAWQAMPGVSGYLVRIDYPGATQTQSVYTNVPEVQVQPQRNKELGPGPHTVSIAAVDGDHNVISPFTRVSINLYNDSDYDFDFKDAAEAESHMTTVTVRVWDFDASGQKVTVSKSLTIHKWVAADVVAIFEDIYNGPERFPIYSVAGYRPGSGGEHPKGTAIDINPNENYEVWLDGRVGVGSFWKPGVNPYSIPLDGDVVKAFRARGWGWGGTDWRSKRDYMHFSYFGT